MALSINTNNMQIHNILENILHKPYIYIHIYIQNRLNINIK